MTLKDSSVFPVKLIPQSRMVVVRTEWKPEKINSMYLPPEYMTGETLVRARVIATAKDCEKIGVGDTIYFTTMAAASEIEASVNKMLMDAGEIDKGQTYVLHEDNIPLKYEAMNREIFADDTRTRSCDIIPAMTSEAGRKREEEKLQIAKRGYEDMQASRESKLVIPRA